MNLVFLGLPTLALSMGLMFSGLMASVCVVWTVIEQPIYISAYFPSSTVAIIDGYTTTVSGATCIDTIITLSQTLNQGPNTVIVNITYELLSHAIERSNNIVSLFKELENIRIDA
jgi:hypothetical protein